jgi:16S rRNA G966 N2-methylase RsmD
MAKHLYYRDNLDILREHIEDESIDLIYLDPPFNSHPIRRGGDSTSVTGPRFRASLILY